MRLINRTWRPVCFRGFVMPFGFSETGLVMNQGVEKVWGPYIGPRVRHPLVGEVVVEESGHFLTTVSLDLTSQMVTIRRGQITTLIRKGQFGGYEGIQLCDYEDDFEELSRKIIVSV